MANTRDVREYLTCEIEELTKALTATDNATELLSEALAGIYRRQQIIGALSALTVLQQAIVAADEKEVDDVSV